jgi:succinate dehydrogenase / fumarate reductase flavoprotein subunit
MWESAERAPVPERSSIQKGMDEEIGRIDSILGREGGESQPAMREELKNTMWNCFGIFRREERMEKGLADIRDIRSRTASVSIDDKGKAFNQALTEVLELEGMVRIAESVGLSALYRRESRGSHFRTDFPKRDDEGFLMHTIASLRNGGLLISYAPVRLGSFEVREREY